MRLLLLAGCNPHALLKVVPQADGRDLPWLEAQIRRARTITPNPVIVLSGSEADDLLRQCPSLEKCELVFDTHGEETTLLTNAKAGLKVLEDPCLLHAAEVPWPDRATLSGLIAHFHRVGARHPADILQVVDHDGCLVNWGFPLLVMPRGRRALLANKALSSLADSQLVYDHLNLEPISSLASEGTSN